MSKGMIEDNGDTSGITGRLELRSLLPYDLLVLFKEKFTCG